MNHNAGVIKSAGLMHNRRGQEMPMQTIVMIIIVLLVLAGVGVFFFTQFSIGQQGASSSQCIQLCQSVNAYYASNTSMKDTDVKSSTAWGEFDKKCDNVNCKVGSWTWTG